MSGNGHKYPMPPWFYDREQRYLYSVSAGEREIICQILDEQTAEIIVSAIAKDYVDKSNAWDAISKKNAEIADLRKALEQIKDACNGAGLRRTLIDRIHSIAIEGLIA